MSVKSFYLERAKYVYDEVVEFKKNHSKVCQSKFKSYSKSIPSYIKMNGLLATVAFLNNKRSGKDSVDKEAYSDDKEAYKGLFDITVKWLKEADFLEIANNNLLDSLVKLLPSEYKNVEREVLSLFTWIRRFAEGELEGENYSELQ